MKTEASGAHSNIQQTHVQKLMHVMPCPKQRGLVRVLGGQPIVFQTFNLFCQFLKFIVIISDLGVKSKNNKNKNNKTNSENKNNNINKTPTKIRLTKPTKTTTSPPPKKSSKFVTHSWGIWKINSSAIGRNLCACLWI